MARFTTERIGRRAFANCFSLKVGPFDPVAMKSIGESAFEGSGITSVNVTCDPDGDMIGAYAFKDCKDLESAEFRNMPNVSDGMFDGCMKLSTFTMDMVVQSVGARAFAGCSSLAMDVIIENCTVVIGESAFEGSGITSVNLTDHGVDFMLSDSVFKDCKALKLIVWPETLTTIPNYTFEGCGVSSVTVPANVSLFGEACFWNCKSLTSVTYLGYAEAPSSVFEGCDALKHVMVADDYPYDEFGGHNLKGLSLGAKIGIGIGVVAFVIIVAVVVVVVLFVTGKIGGGKHDEEVDDAQP